MTDAFFAELEAEIAAATEKSKMKKDAAQLRRDALNMRLDKHIRARAAAELKSIQAIIDAETWLPQQSAAMFSEQACDGCGSVHHNFLQYMQQEKHIRNHAIRWVRVPLPDKCLPSATIIQPLKTHICSDCADEHGFFGESSLAIRLLPMEGSLTVSSNYEQGDINGSPEAD